MLSIHLYFACKALACALREISLEIRLGISAPAGQFGYSRLILNLSLPILCEASLTALGWDEGLLRASQKEPSTMKEQVNVKRIYNL